MPTRCCRQETAGWRVGEAALYLPVKRFLESHGYEVKGEVRGCDLVARRGDEPPVIVELKLRFTLALLLQGVDRLAVSERVYLAVPRPPRRARGLSPEAPAVRRLCRRLGLGLLVVGRQAVTDRRGAGAVPAAAGAPAASRLIAEFDRRHGDPNIGGRSRTPIVTAYRQDALRVARALAANGAMRLAELRAATGVAGAAPILQRNVYGWFARLAPRHLRAVATAARQALAQFAEALAALSEAAAEPARRDGGPRRRPAPAAADRRLFRRRLAAAGTAAGGGLRGLGVRRRFRPRRAALPHLRLVRPVLRRRRSRGAAGHRAIEHGPARIRRSWCSTTSG